MKDWRSVLMQPDVTVRTALSKIDKAATQLGLVVDINGKLIGTVSDGDIRRGILAGMTLDDPVEKCMCEKPVTASIVESRISILSKMRDLELHQVPVVDENGIVIHLAFINDYLGLPKRDNKVVVMAGGPGSRLKELTKKVPKPMLVVGEKPILETIIVSLVDQGFRNISIAVNYHADQIEKHFGDGSKYKAEINYLREQKRLGTAGALSLIENLPDNPILVTNADLLSKVDYNQMLEDHETAGATATMAVREYEYQIPFGVVQTEDGKISSLDEKPVHSVLVNAGVYVLEPEVIKHIPKDTFFDMPQLFEKLIELGYTTRCHKVDGYWLDIGCHDDFCKANNDFYEVFS